MKDRWEDICFFFQRIWWEISDKWDDFRNIGDRDRAILILVVFVVVLNLIKIILLVWLWVLPE